MPRPRDDDPRSPRLRAIERGVEERLRELADAGALSGLPGEGRPFAPEDLAGDDARWAAFRLMKQNRVIPAWSQARIEIDAELARLWSRAAAHRAWRAARKAALRTLAADRILAAVRITEREDQRVTAELADAARALNARIERYNAIVPSEGLRLPPISPGALLDAAS
jgi:hypothetical protein